MKEKNKATLKSINRLPNMILFCLDIAKADFFLGFTGFDFFNFFAIQSSVLGSKIRI